MNKKQQNELLFDIDMGLAQLEDILHGEEGRIVTELRKKIIYINRINLKLTDALSNQLWENHKVGNTYTMDDKPDLWKIAYYPIFEDGKTGEQYSEPRALIEKPMVGGTDFREVPLRYLTPKSK